MYFYVLNQEHPLARSLKIYYLIISLESLLKRLRTLARVVILFGSSARGDFLSESDIDLLIVTTEPDKVEEVIGQYQKRKKIQAIIRSPEGWLAMEKRDPVFYQEVNQGITLYEKLTHESNF